jgi:hypothetical protein
MKVWRILTLTTVLVSISAPLIPGLTTWLTPANWIAVLALMPFVAVAFVLVVYFNWRAKLKSRILADNRRDDELVRAA